MDVELSRLKAENQALAEELAQCQVYHQILKMHVFLGCRGPPFPYPW